MDMINKNWVNNIDSILSIDKFFFIKILKIKKILIAINDNSTNIKDICTKYGLTIQMAANPNNIVR